MPSRERSTSLSAAVDAALNEDSTAILQATIFEQQAEIARLRRTVWQCDRHLRKQSSKGSPHRAVRDSAEAATVLLREVQRLALDASLDDEGCGLAVRSCILRAALTNDYPLLSQPAANDASPA